MTQPSWIHHNPVYIHFGDGAVERLASIVGSAPSILITTSGSVRRGLVDRLVGLLGGPSRLTVFDAVTSNPDVNEIEDAAAWLRGVADGRWIVAAGGGSTLDFAKAVAVLIAGPDRSLRNCLNGGTPLSGAAGDRLIAVPTTAGTGSEVTPFATIWDRSTQRKHSLAGPEVFPHSAVLDPSLTLSLPEDHTVYTGLDALSQGLESIWNRNATPVSLALATRAVELAFEHLPRVVAELKDQDARAGMLQASLLAGLAICTTRTALAHSMSYPLTAHYGMPHGLACGFSLAALWRYNAATDDVRLAELAGSVGRCDAEVFAGHLQGLLRRLEVGERLERFVSSVDDLLALAPEMLTPGRADNNLRPATANDLACILEDAWANLRTDGPQPAP